MNNTIVILSVALTPNPTVVGEHVKISVRAMDVEPTPSVQDRLSGEFNSGEV